MLGGAQAPPHAAVAHAVLDDQAADRFGDTTADRMVGPHFRSIVHAVEIVFEICDRLFQPFPGQQALVSGHKAYLHFCEPKRITRKSELPGKANYPVVYSLSAHVYSAS